MNWKKEDLDLLYRMVPRDKFIVRNTGTGKVQFSSCLADEDFVIAYYAQYDIFIVWGADFHKDKFTGTTHTLSIGDSGTHHLQDHRGKLKYLSNMIQPIQKGLHNDINHEIVYLVGRNALLEFLRHYKEYAFIEADTPSDAGAMRKSVSCTRKQRDPTFRHRVLAHYGYTCIVCGCTDTRLLQAAHIKSVAEGGSDETENGYCLCANHHLLFDHHSLTIDMNTETFYCHGTSEMSSSWYREAAQRNYHLFLLPPDRTED